MPLTVFGYGVRWPLHRSEGVWERQAAVYKIAVAKSLPPNNSAKLPPGLVPGVNELHSVIKDLAHEVLKTKAMLQKDGLDLGPATATLEVAIAKGGSGNAGVSFAVPGIGGVDAKVEAELNKTNTITIEVGLTQGTPSSGDGPKQVQ